MASIRARGRQSALWWQKRQNNYPPAKPEVLGT
jgi:hypothetical protein